MFEVAFRHICMLTALGLAVAAPAAAQELLPGEFGDIDLGRELIEPRRWPTLRELRKAVAEPEMRFVLMLRLHSHENPHHLPNWSSDGRRLAFQRSRPERQESKLLLFPTLGTPEPILLTDRDDTYDYKFRWAVNDDAAYCFTRLVGARGQSRILISTDEQPPRVKATGDADVTAPALYRRTDGIWRMAFERGGNLMHEAWSKDGQVQPPIDIFPGTSPLWSRDGYRLLALRHVRSSNRVGEFEVTLRNLRTLEDRVVLRLEGETIRSPSWSPDESYVAWFSRVGGESAPWNIRISRPDDSRPPRTVAADVVVNPDFASLGATWEPSGRRVWCFSHQYREQAYYPLVAAAADGEAPVVVHYPRNCTTPRDLAINPVTRIPEMAYIGNVGSRRDVFVVFLNHF